MQKYDEGTHFKVYEILVSCCGVEVAAVGGAENSESISMESS